MNLWKDWERSSVRKAYERIRRDQREWLWLFYAHRLDEQGLVVCSYEIDLAEHLLSFKSSCEIVKMWDRVMVRNSPGIQCSVIPAWPPSPGVFFGTI